MYYLILIYLNSAGNFIQVIIRFLLKIIISLLRPVFFFFKTDASGSANLRVHTNTEKRKRTGSNAIEFVIMPGGSCACAFKI